MSTNKAYAQRLKAMGYAGNIIAFKLKDEEPHRLPRLKNYFFTPENSILNL